MSGVSYQALLMAAPSAGAGTLTITDAGNGNSTANGTTVATGATVTASSGDWLVALVAGDNGGASGAQCMNAPTDSAGNTWTERAKINFTPTSASNDGTTLGIYTCAVTSALSSGTVTANFSASITSKAIQVYRVQSSNGLISFIAADTTGLTGNTATHAAATVSVTNGDTIFGAAALENASAQTGDSDTTNGSWSTLIERLANTGTNATSQMIDSQWKTVNATGNQDWAVTAGAAKDSARSYLILRPA